MSHLEDQRIAQEVARLVAARGGHTYYVGGFVRDLVELHMKPNTVAGARSAKKVTTRMFDQAIDPEGLIGIALADDRGRVTRTPATDHEAFLYERLDIFQELMSRPYVMGRDLIGAGLTPGVEFTEILKYAHKLRLAGVHKESALKQTLSYARKLREKDSE